MSLADDGGARVWIPATFVVLAGWFFMDADAGLPDLGATAPFDRSALEVGPFRQRLLTDPPTIEVAGYDQRCSSCHNIFDSPPETDRKLLQHPHIRLDHGLNDRCFNCHSRDNHDRLILHGTEEVPFERSVELCAKCHGPTFRDWELGMHGRTLDRWEHLTGEAQRLRCIDCHDPHAPAFPPIAPLPGPNTLRMGERNPVREHDVHDDARTSPLLRWLRPADDAGSHQGPEHGEPR